SVVVAGDPDAVDGLRLRLEAENVRARSIPVDYASHTSHVELIRDDLAVLLADVEPRTPVVPMFSSVDGAWVEGPVLAGDYWFRNLRQRVNFGAAVEALAESGFGLFVEVSTHPVLVMAIEDAVESSGALVVPTLRRDQPEWRMMVSALARVHAATDLPVDFGLPEARLDVDAPLPTYPFQHERFWLKTVGTTDLPALGLAETGHPLLGAAVHLPGDGAVFTNRLSVRGQPWLADHAVAGTVLVPGTALLELVVRAGDELGAAVVSELVIETPLSLPADGAVQLRVKVGEPGEDGLRPVSVHSRTDDVATADAEWTTHVNGFLSRIPQPPTVEDPAGWPPPGAEAVDVGDFYPRQREAGFEFGPLFQGLRAAWLRDGEVFAEVELPEGTEVPSGFVVHPALLDAALHAAAYLPGREATAARLPFAWNGVAVHSVGATALRVHIRATGADDVAIEVADMTGAPVASIAALSTRPVDPRRLEAAGVEDGLLFRMTWPTLAVTAVPDPLPGPLLDLAAPGDLAAPECARALVHRALEAIQRHLAAAETAPLVVRTRDARRDPAMAAVWGLARAAQTENPGQVVLADVDDVPASARLLTAAVATGEPQFAVHDGVVSVPRLARAGRAGREPRRLAPDGTVLVTGGTGTLGGLVARRLVTHHGVRHLLLTSRRGPCAPDAVELHAELTELGATVTVAACDVGDRDALAELLEDIRPEHALTAVVHTAAVLDDGVFTTLDDERVNTVFGPKVDGAWYLHELTKDLDLAAFVLFSSASGTLGNAGQANYAAGNGFLDGLAEYRRHLGLPATSLAWGLWKRASEMTGSLLDGSRGHLKQDVRAMGDEDGMRLFDATLGRDDTAVLVPIALDLGALGRSANPPAVTRGLLGPGRAAARTRAGNPDPATAGSFVDGLRRLTPPEQVKKLLDVVRAHTAATLGHQGSGAITDTQPFRDLGFDSLAAVDLRNRVGATTGLRLPATLVFDYPTPVALAEHLCDALGITEEPAADRVLAELDRLAAAFDEVLVEAADRAPVAARLRELAARWRPAAEHADLGAAATDDDIFRLAEAELDLS
uniref:type I polyketide synthase n=1 Tax=Amycolatopsis sp. cmx-8-4 TaxID=2790947 RepID=UPI00397B6266